MRYLAFAERRSGQLRVLMTLFTVWGIMAGAAPSSVAALAQTPVASPLFSIKTDDLWLNLHHLLYVLGRAQAGEKDSARAAVSRAPIEAERLLKTFTEQERTTWAEAVTAYAHRLSLKDPIHDDILVEIGQALASAGEAASISSLRIDPEVRQTLESVAAIYQKAWWPMHRSANQAWKASMQPLLEQHGAAILAFILHAYEKPWPVSGYPIHLVAYSNWSGAFSTTGKLLVVSTNSGSGMEGLLGLEILFHESMHQWDREMQQEILEQADRRGKKVMPNQLSHALIWITAGEAVKHAAPNHVPYADVFKIWSGPNQPLKIPLEEKWKPYLNGQGTRTEALAALIGAIPD